jgi:hypothetical protein
MDTQFSGYLHSAIPASVVDDQVLQLIYARYLPGQIPEGDGQGFFFIITGNLND